MLPLVAKPIPTFVRLQEEWVWRGNLGALSVKVHEKIRWLEGVQRHRPKVY